MAAACGLCQQSETFDEDDLYEAMDTLNGRWVAIERQLYSDAFAQGVSLVLYDLSSVYFEGRGPSVQELTATAAITERIVPRFC